MAMASHAGITTGGLQVGNLVRARGREWVVLPDSRDHSLRLRPLGGADEDAILVYLPLEPIRPEPATFPLPDPAKAGSRAAGLLLRDAMRLKLSAGAGPFRSFGHLGVEPRAYQLVPLLMALRQETVRLLIADDVGIGKTIEAGLIVRELLDRGEIQRLAVICPPHLCEQWRSELSSKFHIEAEIVRTGTAARLERGLPHGVTIFDHYPFTIVSLDFIKRPNRLDDFARACPECVIVEEAHGSVRTGQHRHQRFQLLKRLAARADRHMLFLTATPHSGDDEAFHNLLGLLHPDFQALQGLPEGETRRALRERLAHHFVQRQRPDIKEWQDNTIFPDRETREATYQLTGAWGRLFDDVLDFAREMVKRTEGESKLRQRMSWWAALALLRCISSSPAAAALALRTRLRATLGVPDEQQLEEMEAAAAETVLDGASEDELTGDETVPAGTTDEAAERDAARLTEMIDCAEALRGEKNDPKLALLRRELETLVTEGFRPVVFCRYIATAHYLAGELSAPLQRKGAHLEVVTGELTPEEREERILRFAAEAEDRVPVLIATDCLSEGVNLQQHFTAVVHYDLVWNPTRHEQREGRVDRFGQAAPVVRALMIYGENNPVDGAVLRVILRKAERIRKELGVSVPMPADPNQVMQTIMQTVLLQTGGIAEATRQLALDLGEVDATLERDWQSAKEKARESRTIFAQRRLRPEDVLPEWDKATAVLGGPADVERFMVTACERLGAPLHEAKRGWRLATEHLPGALKERLAGFGIEKPVHLVFDRPGPPGTIHATRAHPIVTAVAEYVTELGLAEEGEVAARSAAMFTQAVPTRTFVLLLRLRTQILVQHTQGDPPRHLMAEECVAVRLGRDGPAQILDDAQSRAFLGADPARNMAPEQRARMVDAGLQVIRDRAAALAELARSRAEQLRADHTRVRDAAIGRSEARGYRIEVQPCLPVDVIGLYVLVPAQPGT
jgi:superfamily II DNA or RNA helicase